ncbi:HD-GYP domain-containing protein [Clostridium kluyveri]|uniref:HD-GYP domain-containing protein n=1 Tax=Clostridium kluyveri TaxID=1534 RepID=UPI002248138B|nr:HD domain-containing phosphohydrolase [Clostridium kluyveri]UZQ51507.1 HD domain-containing protein [Clostridium kluyveri]
MIRIYTDELIQGMVLGDSIYCKQTGKLLLVGGTILSEATIRLLKQNGISTVKIVDRYTLFVKPTETISKELKQALDLEIIKHAPDSLEANTSDNMVHVSKIAREVVSKLIEDEIILNFCTEMKILNNEYLFKHSVNTCAISLLVAGAMGLGKNQMYIIGAGALLHDIGLCEMPFLIDLHEMTSQQTLLWQQHPTYGYHFTKEKALSPEITEIIHYHHEKWNGSGFPEKLKGNNIPLGSRIVAVCGEYDKLLVFGKYQPYQAIEYLYGSGGYLFDIDVINAFTNNLAVYPLGSLVRLTTKEVGVVVNVRKNLGPRPIVRVYFNRVNRPLSEVKDVDLGIENTIFIEEVL